MCMLSKNEEFPAQVLIPQSVANGSISPPRLLQYGHGLFGSQVHVYALGHGNSPIVRCSLFRVVCVDVHAHV